MSEIAIKVENISKKYQIGENKSYPTLRDKLMELPGRLFKGPKKNKEFWALKDVSVEVKKGEVVGIIGRNGAGKSTLLKILARITEPTTGQITMYGRVASMLEVGTGFNPELTGRENIFLNGAIIGMTKKEIKSKFDDIVEFSGVSKFLDTPVKHYSSGMYVRLAFAVAAHLDADILLVDEVLAVGDAEFQKKCLGKMSDLAKSGRTVIFVSHDVRSIRFLCTKALLFSEGKLIKYGDVHQIVKIYFKNQKSVAENDIYLRDIRQDKNILIIKVEIFSEGKRTNKVIYNKDITLKITTSQKCGRKFGIELIIKNFEKERIGYATSMIQNGYNYFNSGDTLIVKIPNMSLAEGQYWIDINCRQYPHVHIDKWLDTINFYIYETFPNNIPHHVSSEDNLGNIIYQETSYKKEKQ